MNKINPESPEHLDDEALNAVGSGTEALIHAPEIETEEDSGPTLTLHRRLPKP